MKIWFDRLFDGVHGRRTVLIIFDTICFLAVSLFFYVISINSANSLPMEKSLPVVVNCVVHMCLLIFSRILFGIYNNVWRYANTTAYFKLVLSDAAAGVATVFLVRLVHSWVPGVYYGLWQPAVVGSLTALTVLVSRFAYCLIYKANSKRGQMLQPRKPVAVIGAGQLGAYLVEDLHNNPKAGYEPMFFVDVDATKIGNFVAGLKVYDPETAQELIEKLEIKEVVVTITSQDSAHLAELYQRYTTLGCKVRIYESMIGGAQKRVLRDFSIEDLLFRKPISLNDENTVRFYEGKTVLVTGGGGSIGSELCRRIAACRPEKLVIFDIYENNAYEIQQELLRAYGKDLNLVVEIGSVRDVQRLEQLFETHRPHVVFHAAAHKHVPLMEHCGAEAIKNNVFGTDNTANAAEKYGTEKFILISTDKAVNPTNIMGASKRLCEMVVQCRKDSATSFSAVRFGNVLGSNGSVIPLFKKQIAEGGPVTVTDKRIIRYFMTIPEASQLVIQAGAMAKSGELFVLDMGKPVKIYELAETMIRLSGFEPGKDIEIKEIGLRPGEKLYEELLIKSEQVEKTENRLIFIEKDEAYSRMQIEKKLRLLESAMSDLKELKAAILSAVPTYRSPDEVNQRADHAEEMQMSLWNV